MKSLFIVLIALIMSGCASLDLPSPGKTLGGESGIQDSTEIDCNRFIGRWSGEKIWSAERTSRWLSTHHADGTMHIDFTTLNKGEARQEAYTGTWVCGNGGVQIRTTDSHGETRTYTYRILELTERFMHYQLEDEKGLGPKFTAERVR